MNKKYLTLYFDEAATGTNEANPTSTDDKSAAAGNAAKQEPDNKPTDEKDEKKYSDNDLDKIIEKKMAKWQKQKSAEIDEAAKLANMNAQEKAEHERDKLQAELDALKKANAKAEMEKTARNILQTGGVNIPDKIVSYLVGEDAEETSENVKAFTKVFKEAVQAEVKAQLSHKSPATGSTGKGMTRAEIDKIEDPIKRQALIKANMNLYSKKK